MQPVYKNKSVLITGGLGFIGSNLARELLKHGSQVTIVDSHLTQYGANLFNIEDIEDQLTVNICDLRETNSISQLIKDKDYLFNLAGQTSHLDSMVAPQTDVDINVSAQLSILEACREYNPEIKIVFTSTRQIYGKPHYLPVDENHCVHPVDVNGINKHAGEQYHLLYYNVYGIKSSVIRLTNTYGPRMRVKDARQTFLGIWIRKLIEGSPLKVFGSGTQIRDFNYVSDCVHALMMAGINEKANGKIYNLGSLETINLKDLAQILVDLNESGCYELVSFPVERKVIDIGDYQSDFSLITRELNWRPTITLRDGLKKTIEYYKKHNEHYW
jgi:UDP-glucose 4-epimerase